MGTFIKNGFACFMALVLLGSLMGCKEEIESDLKNTASFDGTPIAYSVYGDGEEALVFIHGWSCDSRYWQNQIEEFSDDFTVVTIDLAGHGHSGLSRETYTMESFGKDIKAVVEELDLKNVILIGHSMGGPVCLFAAREMPERVIGVIGADTMHNFSARYSDEEHKMLLDPIKKNFSEGTSNFVKGMFIEGTDEALVNAVAHDMSSAPPHIALSAMQELFKVEEDTVIKDLSVPIVCVNADMWPTDYEANRKIVPTFRLYMIKRSGHFPMLAKPKKFNSKLERAIDYIIDLDEENESN